MSIVNPTILKSSGDVSEALGIFAVGARGEKQRLHLPTLMHELIQDVITLHGLGITS